jgi:hypothetical protein
VKQALRQLLGDFLSAILFLVVYALSGDLFAAIAVAAGVAQLARFGRPGGGSSRCRSWSSVVRRC